MDFIYNVAIKEEKLSDDEDTSTFCEDEEKLFLDAPIKFEYPEDDNYEPMIKKLKDSSQLEKNVENKTCWKTDNGSQTVFCENSDFLKAATKPINVACQTEASAKRAEVGCQTEDGWKAVDIVRKKEVLSKVESMDATDSTTPPRTVNGQSATGTPQSASCTDLEKQTNHVTDSPVSILAQDMLNGIEKPSPTEKDLAITLSLTLCKGLIQTLKPRTVPKSILHNLSREVVTSVRDALSKIGSTESVPSTVSSPAESPSAKTLDAPESTFLPVKLPDASRTLSREVVISVRDVLSKFGLSETVPSTVSSLAESPSAKTQDAPESKFLPVKLPDASRSCLKSRDNTGKPGSDEGKSTPKPLEPLSLPKAESTGSAKEEPEELEEEYSELAYSFIVAGIAGHISQGKKRFGSITCIFVRKDLKTSPVWKNGIIIIGAVFV